MVQIVITGEQIAHFLAGILSALAVIVSPILSVLGVLIFIVYELDQDLRKSDFMDEECAEMGYGFFLGVVILLILKSLCII